ncbi:hypothetical protein diail_1265 [Diaporthe ilicicola]|nr:hypothetical protein diail_1265 [Diaporthe ilicicola]
MCDWEEFIFGCSCSYTKRKNYCHFARNDPNHQCFGVQVLKKVWDVPEVCDKCSQKNNRTSTRSYQHYGQDSKIVAMIRRLTSLPRYRSTTSIRSRTGTGRRSGASDVVLFVIGAELVGGRTIMVTRSPLWSVKSYLEIMLAECDILYFFLLRSNYPPR